MFKLAAAVIDFYDDPDFLSNNTVRGMMGAGLIEPSEVHGLKDSDFAVKIATAAGVHRKFPVYSRIATALSGEYFDKIAALLPEPIRDTAGYHLKIAHVLRGLPLPMGLQRSFPEAPTNTVEWRPDPEVAGLTSGVAVVKCAERVFVDRSRQMTLLEKVAKAADILKTANLYGAEITEREIVDYSPKDDLGPFFRDMMQQRETLVRAGGEGMLKQAFSELLDIVVKTPVREIPFIVHQFDKVAGFVARYGRGVIDPFYGTWGGVAKIATVEEDEKRYKLETITRGDGAEAIQATFGERLASRFLRDPIATYPTLRPAEKKFVDFLIASVGAKEPQPSEETFKKIESAKNDVKKEQASPSNRPSREFRAGGRGTVGVVEDGL
jgi:hypothetical protein